jgi:phenylacetate-coenzyme A ligase PaaK-like adenylate-forming protein
MKNYSVKSFIPTQVFPAIPLPDHALRLALLYQLEHSQWWKEADIKKTQYGQIKKILSNAYQTVPYLTATELDINIRQFELGDYAEFGPPCKCGRGLPVIQRVLGRHFNRLFIPTESGTQSVFPCLGRHDLTATELDINIRQFQCVQHSLKLVEFKLVMDCKMTAEQEAESR